MLSRWPPLKLAKLGFAGAVLSLTVVLTPWLVLFPVEMRHGLLGAHADLSGIAAYDIFSVAIAYSPALIGCITFVLAKQELETGLGSERWSNGQTEQLLRLMDSPAPKIVWWLAVCVSLITIPAVFRYGFNIPAVRITADFIALGSALVCKPHKAATELSKLLRPEPPTPRPGSAQEWSKKYKPIHSDHWGTRNNSNPDVQP